MTCTGVEVNQKFFLKDKEERDSFQDYIGRNFAIIKDQYKKIKSQFLKFLNKILFFTTSIDLQKNCKYTTEFSHTLYPTSPRVNILHNTIIKTNKFTFVQYY